MKMCLLKQRVAFAYRKSIGSFFYRALKMRMVQKTSPKLQSHMCFHKVTKILLSSTPGALNLKPETLNPSSQLDPKPKPYLALFGFRPEASCKLHEEASNTT